MGYSFISKTPLLPWNFLESPGARGDPA